MKTSLFIVALGLISTSSVLAGGSPTVPVPDAGASVLLLSIGVAAIGLARKFRP